MRADRTWWKAKGEERIVENPEDANLVSSLLTNDLHSPVLDIDFEAELVPSSTPGHYHLYLDGLELTWEAYEELLLALAKAGVIEQGYADAQIPRRATFVRPPGAKKFEGDGLGNSEPESIPIHVEGIGELV